MKQLLKLVTISIFLTTIIFSCKDDEDMGIAMKDITLNYLV